MLNRLVITCSLVIYVAAMCVSLTAHDPFHMHHSHGDHSHSVAHHDSHSHGKHSHSGDHHHHGHSHKHECPGHSESEKSESTSHDHDHDCPVCEFLTLKSLEITIAEVESASELIQLAEAAAVNYHTACSPYQPPSRAPPVC